MAHSFRLLIKLFLRSCLLGLAPGLLVPAFVSAQTTFVHPAKESPYDVRYDDLIEILTTALDKTVPEYGPYTLTPAAVPMNEAHQLFALERGEHISVIWTSTSVEKERVLLPVRIPLRKGLLGYRICLIQKEKQAVLDNVRTLDDLRKLIVGQGSGWGDTRVYEANGISVFTADYDSLFKMTANGRFDLFPRGVGEVYRELEARAGDTPGLAVEENLVIYYPWPYYFFFNKKDVAMAQRVEAGLRIMLKDGTFEAIFQKYNKEAIARANLKHRHMISISNPLLPEATPLNDKKLWFTP